MIFNHGELPSEQEEAGDLEAIVEVELILGPELPVEQPPDYDVPQDDYLEKELER